MPVKQSLVLDGEKDELVKISGRLGKENGVSDAKTLAALKSHCEAERRRRERINAHFATLRGLVPSNEKMDKATLLAEVISQVKQMKKTAACASEGLHIPMDHDEVKVEEFNENQGDDTRTFSFKASLCSDYRPHLLSDLRQSIDDLPVKLLRAEISTLRSRVKSVFFLTASEERPEARDVLINSVHSALSNILDKVSASTQYSQSFFPRKRSRASYFDS
ncbi:transcription factor bHLH30-like [Primulina eburnea]|uniref:transcription factor bHLH30-like n=1 Tax=Primulina eburnea TaxID=1245227 RepID=UPI003C6C6F76